MLKIILAGKELTLSLPLSSRSRSRTHSVSLARMEAETPASENPDQTVCIQKDHDEGASQRRSYKCSFCKKLFSNAQALGGHMNIHRKEKAKLKEAPQDNQDLLDFPCAKTTDKPNLELISSQVKSTTPKRPWDFSSSEDSSTRSSPRSRTLEAGEVKQLPLFDETVARNIISPKPTGETVDEDSREGLPSNRGAVDLELRLGHQEPKESSDTMIARKFF